MSTNTIFSALSHSIFGFITDLSGSRRGGTCDINFINSKWLHLFFLGSFSEFGVDTNTMTQFLSTVFTA